MPRLLAFAGIAVLALAGCDASYSDVRDVPAFPGSEAYPLQITPRVHPYGFPDTYNPAIYWSSTLDVDSLIAPTYGVPVLGYQGHTIRDTVTLADVAGFLDARLGPRGFRRSAAPAVWQLPFQQVYMGGDGEKPQVAAWVRDAPAGEGTTDRTVVTVAYATPWPAGQDRTRQTFYIVFLGRGTVGKTGTSGPTGGPTSS